MLVRKQWWDNASTVSTVQIISNCSGSAQKDCVWYKLAESLNSLPTPVFRVTGCSVRNHFNTLIVGEKERKQFGIYPEKEVEISFADITERFERKIVNMPKVADSKNKKDDCTKHLKCGKAVWTLLLKVKVVHFKKTQWKDLKMTDQKQNPILKRNLPW